MRRREKNEKLNTAPGGCCDSPSNAECIDLGTSPVVSWHAMTWGNRNPQIRKAGYKKDKTDKLLPNFTGRTLPTTMVGSHDTIRFKIISLKTAFEAGMRSLMGPNPYTPKDFNELVDSEFKSWVNSFEKGDCS